MYDGFGPPSPTEPERPSIAEGLLLYTTTSTMLPGKPYPPKHRVS